MLVLSRKKNESIIIDDCITITVVEIRGDKVRLGIEAPREMPIHRQEVRDALTRQEREEIKRNAEQKAERDALRELPAVETLIVASASDSEPKRNWFANLFGLRR